VAKAPVSPPPVPLSATLGPKITSAAAVLGAAAPSLTTNNGKTYETWALFELAAGLSASRTVQAAGHDAQPLSGPFIVRGGPGLMPPPSNAGTEPSFFVVAGGAHWFEIHNSLQHRGTSGETHELDVSVVPGHFAAKVRAQAKDSGNRLPYEGPVIAGLEMKAYDAGATIPKSFARGLLGLVLDIAPMSVVSVSMGQTTFTAWPFTSSTFGLMTTADMTGPTDSFLRHYGLEPGQSQNHTGQGSLDKFIASVAALV
jgi:hypothetical protein